MLVRQWTVGELGKLQTLLSQNANCLPNANLKFLGLQFLFQFFCFEIHLLKKLGKADCPCVSKFGVSKFVNKVMVFGFS